MKPSVVIFNSDGRALGGVECHLTVLNQHSTKQVFCYINDMQCCKTQDEMVCNLKATAQENFVDPR